MRARVTGVMDASAHRPNRDERLQTLERRIDRLEAVVAELAARADGVSGPTPDYAAARREHIPIDGFAD